MMSEIKVRDGRTLPFFQVDNRLIDDCNLDSASKLIYIALCRYSNNGSKAFPSLQKIADVCSVSKSTVIRRIDELEKKGYIIKEKRTTTSGADTSNVYKILDIPSVRETLPPVSERHSPSVRETLPPVSEGHSPSVRETPNKEQVIKNNIKKNKLKSCCSLDEVPTNTIESLENIESSDSTNKEQTIISDLQALNIPTTNFVVETVREWTEEHDVELLQAVIDKCVSTACNGVNLNYLKKAIDRLTTQGIKTLNDLERAEELRAKQRISKYAKQQRVEVMPTYEAPVEMVSSKETEHELAMIKYMLGQALHPDTQEANENPLT